MITSKQIVKIYPNVLCVINSIKYLSRTLTTNLENQQIYSQTSSDVKAVSYIDFSTALNNEAASFKKELLKSMIVHENFLSETEEDLIMKEIEPYMKRMHYEFDHWDNAIHGYRETERLKWNTENTQTLNRVRQLAFPRKVNQLKFVHILDLDAKGYIKPHIDAIRFCGDTIAGLSLLTDSVMRLTHDKRKQLQMDVLLSRRSLYIMKGTARFDYTHEILKNEQSMFRNVPVAKTRRISVICRNEPNPADTIKQ